MQRMKVQYAWPPYLHSALSRQGDAYLSPVTDAGRTLVVGMRLTATVRQSAALDVVSHAHTILPSMLFRSSSRLISAVSPGR